MINGQQPTTETPLNGDAPRSRRRAMGLRLFRYGGALIVLLSLLGLAGWLYFRSARFNRQVASFLETRLGEFGLRGEIGGFGWTLDPQAVRLRDIHLYNLQTGAPVATIGELTIEAEIIDPYALRMGRDVILKAARLSEAELEILVDRNGRSNLTELRLPAGGAGRVSLDLSQLQVTLEEGRLRYQDERIGWGVALDGLSVSARSGAAKGPLDLALTAGATGGTFRFEGRSSPIERLDLVGRVGAKGLLVERFGMSAALATISGAEGVVDWAPFDLGIGGEVRTQTAELAKLFFPAGLELAGEVVCQCRVEATGAGVTVEGSPTAARLTIEGAALTGIDTRAARFELAKGRTRFFAQRARARSVQIETIELDAVEIRAARGEVVEGVTRILAPEANLTQVTWPGSHLDALRLSVLRADFPGKGFRVAAQAALTAGEIAGLPFEEVATKARLDPTKLVLEELTARIEQGKVEAGATVPLRRGLPFLVAGRFREIPSREVFGLLDLEALPVSGAVDGEGELTWIGARPETLSGRIAAQFAGTTTPLAGELPLAGPIQVEAEEGRFRFEKFDLRTQATQLGVSGTLAVQGESDLALTLDSDRPEELLAVARTLAPLAPLIEKYHPFLKGHAGFSGQLNGNVRAPILHGHLTVEEVGLRTAGLGGIAGGIVLTGDALRVEKGRLGSASRFDLDLPFDQAAQSGRLSATIAELEITRVLEAFDWQALDPTGISREVAGQLVGTLALTGLPGKIQGTVSLGLERAVILRQAARRADAEIRFVDHVARLSSLAIRLPQTNFESEGFWNLTSGAYELKGQASQISLSALAEALEIRQLRIEGEGETRFVVSGRFAPEAAENAAPDPFSLTLIANTSQLKINQRPVVDYRVYAGTSAQGVLRVAINTLSGPAPRREEELLLVTAALRDPVLPVTVRGEVWKMEIAPLLAILAPDQEWIRNGTLSGRVSIQGPTRTAQGERTIERLAGDLVLEEMQVVVAENQLRLASPVSMRVEGGKMAVPPARLLGQGVELVVRGTTGIAAEGPLDLSLRGSLNLADLSGIESALSLQGVQGRVTIEAQAGGTVQTPNLTGAVDLQNLGLSFPDLPIFLTNGNGLLTLAGETLRIESFQAMANEGRLEARGELQLDQLQPRQWQLRFKIEGAEVHDRDLSASLSTELSLTGTPDGQTLTGSINTTRLEYDARIDLDSLLASGAAGGTRGGGAGLEFDLRATGLRGRQSATGPSSLPPTRINIRLEARDTVAVRSEQINALGSALLILTGTTQDPSLTGRLESESGFVRFRGQRYEITQAALDLLPGTTGATLTLVAESEFRGYRVLLGLNGQIDALETTLRSEPPLSRDEILALITTGRAEAGPLTSQDPLRSGVGAAASLLTSGLISRPTEQLLGLSRFQIDPIIRPNTNPAARLTVGQQLSRNLYVSYSTNLATEQDQTALAEYTLTNRFSGLATYSQGGSSTRQGLDENVFTIELRGRQRFSLGVETSLAPRPESPSTGTNALGSLRTGRLALPRAEVQVIQPEPIDLSEKRLRQFLPVMTQGFSRSLVRLGERRLREYLQEQGYFFAEVQSRCEPLDCSGTVPRVIYTIDLNEVYELKEIRLEGTTQVRLEEIRGGLQSETASRVGGIPFLKDLPLIGGYVRGLTSNERLRSDEELIRRRLVDQGYLEARVKTRLAIKPEQNDLLLLFQVEEGPLSKVGQIGFEGQQRATEQQLRELVPLQVDAAYSPTLARLGTQQIRQHYAARGYLEASVSLEVATTGEDDRLALRYRVVEGPQVVVSRIRIAGATRSGAGWIERYYNFRVGEVLTPEKIRATQASLYSTNAFREVLIGVGPLPPGEGSGHEVTLTLSEAKPLLFVYGLGYSTDDGVRGTLELANTNLRGSLDSLSFRLRASQREQITQLSFSDLRPFGWKAPTTISTFYNRSANLRTFVQRRVLTESGQTIDSPDGRGFGLERFGIFIQTERKLDARTSLRFRYNVERASLFGIEEGQFRGTEVTRNERVIRLGLLSAGISRDTRDNVLNPTRGQLISADHSLAAVPLGGNESFNKFFGTYQRYQTIDPGVPGLGGTTIALSARVGLGSVFRIADRNRDGSISESESRLPISERFFSGGATTIRGFRFETAGPQEVLEARPGRGCDQPGRPCDLPTLVPIGGDALAILNLELRYPLTERLRFVPFYDLGNVFRRVRDLHPRGMTNTVGLGLRINTPIGPVGLDYGFLIDPPGFPATSGALIRQPRGVIHIRLGQSF